MKLGLLRVAVALTAATPVSAQPSTAAVDRFLSEDAFTPTTADQVSSRCDRAATLAGGIVARLGARRGPAAMATDFRDYDDLMAVLRATEFEALAVTNTAVAKPVRDAGQACQAKITAVEADVALSRPIYDRLNAIAAHDVPADARFLLERTLLAYRLAGVDRSEVERGRIAALTKAQSETGQTFERNTSEDVRTVDLPAEALAGMPADFVAAHPLGTDGKIHLRAVAADYRPIMVYATNEAARRAMGRGFMNRAWPINEPVLNTLIAQRAALAKAVGFPSYAALNVADKMALTPSRVSEFLEEISAVARPAGQHELGILLARERRTDAEATEVSLWSQQYLTELVRKEQYDVDGAQVRRYFTLEKVRVGLFRFVRDMFGGEIRPWRTALWAPGVTAWSLYDHDHLIGHFYLDLSPRDGKYNHVAMFPGHAGGAGRTPIAMLLTNFPAQGQMEHADVVNFFHEFGHLVHYLYAGHHRYTAQGFDNLEFDFVEAPSQLLENWVWDYDTLRTFATDDRGRPIPPELVARLNRARHFGAGMRWTQQLGDGALSLGFYTRPPGFDLKSVNDALEARYALIPEPADTHWYASFTHLNGYGASLYTYAWSEAIALDLFTRFRAAGLRDQATAAAYRRQILENTGTKSAAQLTRDFLGRDWSTEAFKADLSQQ